MYCTAHISNQFLLHIFHNVLIVWANHFVRLSQPDEDCCIHRWHHLPFGAIEGIQATVDLEKNCAFVEGEADEATLKQAIEEAGYTYKGIE